jgi:hypothetical protein
LERRAVLALRGVEGLGVRYAPLDFGSTLAQAGTRFAGS